MGDVSGLACGWIRDCNDLRTICQVLQLKTGRKERIRVKGEKGNKCN